MSEQTIEYVPISKLSRGYAGRIIDDMKEKNAVIYIMRNNEPDAVIMSMSQYRQYLYLTQINDRFSKMETSRKLASRLHAYADEAKIAGEREAYIKAVTDKHAGGCDV